jgi:hypothetical protein
MKTKCSTPKCNQKPVLQLLGKHPICRKCGDIKNEKSRARSAAARARGHYSPSILARRKEEKKVAYTQRKDGEGWEEESGKVFRLACCDCGLVHDVVIVTGEEGQKVGIAAKRNKQETEQRRDPLGKITKNFPLPWEAEKGKQEVPPGRRSVTIYASDSSLVCRISGEDADGLANVIVNAVNSYRGTKE